MVKARTGDQIGAVFLSPRVVDAAAFEELAGTLRSLLSQAGEQGASLSSAVARCEAVAAQLAATTPAVEAKLAAAAAAMRALAARQRELESLLARTQERAQSAEQRTAEFEARLAGETEARSAAGEARIAGLVEAAMGRIEAAGAATGARLSDASDGAERAAADAARRLEPAERRLLERAAEIEARLEEAERRATPMLGAGLKSLAVLCARAEAILGGEAGRAGSLPDLVHRAEGAREAVEFAALQLNAVQARAERAAAMLGAQVAASAQTVEGFAARQESVSEAMTATLAACEEARRRLQEHAEGQVRLVEGAAAAASAPGSPRKRHPRKAQPA